MSTDAAVGEPPVSEAHPVHDDGRHVYLWLAAQDVSAAQARRHVRERWQQLDDNVLDDVALIVTELVSNAVRHGRPEIVLRLRVEPFAVDVAVLDHGEEMPPDAAPQAQLDATSGRGLAIIDTLAARWGVEPFADGGGKAVWASIRTDQTPAA